MSIILEALKKAERDRSSPGETKTSPPVSSLVIQEPRRVSSLPIAAVLVGLLIAGAVIFLIPVGKKWITSRIQKEKNVPVSPVQDPVNLHTRALGLFQKGDLEGSLATWKELTQRSPDDFEAFNNLGFVLKQMGRKNEAEAAYESALKIKPDYPFAHNNLGALLMEQQQTEKAEEHLRTALSLDPRYADAHFHLAILLEKRSQKEEAAQHYEHFLNLSPGIFIELKDKISTRIETLKEH